MKDGIIDDKDKCPPEAETKNNYQDDMVVLTAHKLLYQSDHSLHYPDLQSC